jgi:aerobic-type carbon monoxide dehydrogenase small subunit (CoxS/CutS family)
MSERVTLTVNGEERSVITDPGRPLLEVLREDLGLTGTKYGCGEGSCGACTVLVGGRPVFSCNTPVERVAGQVVETIEGIGTAGNLHAVQQAFLDENAFQCGYCTPGMIMAVVGYLREKPTATEKEMIGWLETHICRCCGYPAIRRVAERVTSTGRSSKEER